MAELLVILGGASVAAAVFAAIAFALTLEDIRDWRREDEHKGR